MFPGVFFWSMSGDFFKPFTKVIYIGKSGFLCNFRYFQICCSKQFLSGFDPNFRDVLKQRSVLAFFEDASEIGGMQLKMCSNFCHGKRCIFIVFFNIFNDFSTQNIVRRRQHIVSLVATASARGLFEVEFQPLCDTEGNFCNRAECLVRLPDGKGGRQISPEEFIPIAEAVSR